MAFGFAGAASGASDVLQQLLSDLRAEGIRREQLRLQQEAAERQQSQFDSRMALDRDQFNAMEVDRAADRTYREGQVARQGRLDDVEAGERRQAQNAVGVRRMIGDFLVQRGAKPLDAGNRQTLQGMALQEGIPSRDLPDSVTTDPEAELRDYEAKRKLDAKYRAPSGGSAPNFNLLVSPSGEQREVPQGQATNALLAQGWKKFDPVAARQTPPVDSAEARAITESALAQAKRLRTHPGIDEATGAYEVRGFTQNARNFNSIRNQLVSALAYPNLGALRGPLSDKDILFLKQLSTRVGDTKIDRAETERAIDEAIQFLESKLAAGDIQAPVREGNLTWDPVKKTWVR